MFTWCTMPVPGGTTLNSSNAVCPQRRNWYRSRLRSYSSSTFRSKASARPKMSAITEWSMTSSAGASGLILSASPPRSAIASRMVARSTTHGHAGEVLHDHPRRGELDLGVRLGVRIPVRQRADVVGGDVGAVLGADQVLQKDLQAERQLGRVLQAWDVLDPVDPVALRLPARGDGERVGCGEAVRGRVRHDGLLMSCAGVGRRALSRMSGSETPCRHGVSVGRR